MCPIANPLTALQRGRESNSFPPVIWKWCSGVPAHRAVPSGWYLFLYFCLDQVFHISRRRKGEPATTKMPCIGYKTRGLCMDGKQMKGPAALININFLANLSGEKVNFLVSQSDCHPSCPWESFTCLLSFQSQEGLLCRGQGGRSYTILNCYQHHVHICWKILGGC